MRAQLRDSRLDLVIDSAGGPDIKASGDVLAPRDRWVTFGLSGRAAAGYARRSGWAWSSKLSCEGASPSRRSRPSARPARSTTVTRAPDADHRAYDADLRWLLARPELAPPIVAMPLERAAATHAEVDAGRIHGRAVLDHRA